MTVHPTRCKWCGTTGVHAFDLGEWHLDNPDAFPPIVIDISRALTGAEDVPGEVCANCEARIEMIGESDPDRRTALYRHLQRTLLGRALVPADPLETESTMWVEIRDPSTRQPILEPVMTRGIVAERAGVEPDTIGVYVSRGTIPAPDARVGDVEAWRESTVTAWLASRRGPGRPRKTTA